MPAQQPPAPCGLPDGVYENSGIAVRIRPERVYEISRNQQELGDLGLEGRLHEQANAQVGHLLQDLAELTVGGEQLVDVGADALDGGYSFRHGCGFPFFACQA